jgi:hypothetical protein
MQDNARQHLHEVSLSILPSAPEEHSIPAPMSAALRNIVDLSTLPEDERTCAICFEPYEANDVDKPISERHAPVKVECGHILGLNCLYIVSEISVYNLGFC